jgi:TetR/AcrR family transcriptional regulator, regulator of cefoperazone and chloramphenicol sensitivity
MFETTVTETPSGDPHDTHLRLIEAAGAVFAEKGFRGAQVRDICRRARANVAAVNYHFRNKAGLYEAVLRHAQRCAVSQYPLDAAVPHEDPRQRLASLIEMFLRRLLEGGTPSWLGKLLMREFVDPTPALRRVCRDFFEPTFKLFKDALRPLLRSSPAELERATQSVLATCLFYRLADAPLRMMNRIPPGTSKGIRALARHIAEFALGGLDGLRNAARSKHERL